MKTDDQMAAAPAQMIRTRPRISRPTAVSGRRPNSVNAITTTANKGRLISHGTSATAPHPV